MNHSIKHLTIGQFARQAGVGIDTVRFYERAGLIPAASRTASGYRTYSDADIRRMRFIRRSKALGFTLEEIAELLSLSAGQGGRAEVKALAERRLQDLDVKIQELTALRDTLASHARRCSGRGPVAGCPIIEAVLAATPTEKIPCNIPTPRKTRPSRTAAAR